MKISQQLKKSALGVACIIISLQSFAGINAASGFYVGGEVGLYHNHLPDSAALSSAIVSAFFRPFGRPFIGYRFSDYCAVEGSYAFLMDDDDGAQGNTPLSLGPDHAKQYSFDLAAKLIYPLTNGFSIFGKAGGAWVHQDVYNQLFVGDPAPLIDSQVTKLLPLVGAGISYNYTQKVATAFSYTHIQGNGIIKNFNMIGASISYTFA